MITEREGHRSLYIFYWGDLFEDLLETRLLRDVISSRLLGFRKTRFPRLVAKQPVEALDLVG